jgi:hypothetical protein
MVGCMLEATDPRRCRNANQGGDARSRATARRASRRVTPGHAITRVDREPYKQLASPRLAISCGWVRRFPCQPYKQLASLRLTICLRVGRGAPRGSPSPVQALGRRLGYPPGASRCEYACKRPKQRPGTARKQGLQKVACPQRLALPPRSSCRLPAGFLPECPPGWGNEASPHLWPAAHRASR